MTGEVLQSVGTVQYGGKDNVSYSLCVCCWVGRLQQATAQNMFKPFPI